MLVDIDDSRLIRKKYLLPLLLRPRGLFRKLFMRVYTRTGCSNFGREIASCCVKEPVRRVANFITKLPCVDESVRAMFIFVSRVRLPPRAPALLVEERRSSTSNAGARGGARSTNTKHENQHARYTSTNPRHARSYSNINIAPIVYFDYAKTPSQHRGYRNFAP